MAKRWLHSADVKINDSNGALLTELPLSSTFAGGTKTVASTGTPEKLVSVSTPCQFVWLGARVNSTGQALNYRPVFIGDAAGQNIPIMPSNFEGMVIRIDNANKIYVKVGTNGEGVVYRIFS